MNKTNIEDKIKRLDNDKLVYLLCNLIYETPFAKKYRKEKNINNLLNFVNEELYMKKVQKPKNDDIYYLSLVSEKWLLGYFGIKSLKELVESYWLNRINKFDKLKWSCKAQTLIWTGAQHYLIVQFILLVPLAQPIKGFFIRFLIFLLMLISVICFATMVKSSWESFINKQNS